MLAICVLIACLTRKHGVDAEVGVILLSLMRVELVCCNSMVAGRVLVRILVRALVV